MIKEAIRKWLKLEPADRLAVTVKAMTDHETTVFLDRLWWRGRSYELEQAYHQLELGDGSFWASTPTTGMEIRKIHTGLPNAIVRMLTNLTMADFDMPDTGKPELAEMLDENDLTASVYEAVKTSLALGDGAWKLSYDTGVSTYPLLEFVPADRVEFVDVRGRIREIIFRSDYRVGEKVHVLHEHYGPGYIRYELNDDSGNPADLESVPVLAGLADTYWQDKSLTMAVPFRVLKSETYRNRGQSIFDGKRDNFDALDEAWSQWMDALRANRTKTYIPEDLVPRDPRTGAPLIPSAFDNRFIETETSSKEGDRSQIVSVSPGIPSGDYMATYITALDLCLQGIISPSTLGIDNKKLDNAEAQREKEKATLYTRDAIVNAVDKAIPVLVNAMWGAYQLSQGKPLEPVDVECKFGEYANPSFEAAVETVAKGKGAGVMSTEAAIEELYGDTKPEKWKREEVARIQAEQGLVDVGDPMGAGSPVPWAGSLGV